MKDKKPSWEQQMAAAMAGDKRAYATLLTEISRYMRGYLRTKLSSEADVEDVIQEALTSIHKARSTYEHGRPLKPWINAITNFRLNDFFRKHYKKREREVIDYDSIAFSLGEDVTEAQDAHESIHRALGQLPEKQRQLITWTKLEGHSMKDVASKTGMSVSAVKVAVHRATKKLKKVIEG